MVQVNLLDFELLSFSELRNGNYSKYSIVKYDDGEFVIKFPPMKVPFGSSKSSVTVSFGEEWETSQVYKKICELDQKFLGELEFDEKFSNLVEPDSLSGSDEKGLGGTYKRLIKWQYNKNKETGEITYKNYPPNLNCSLSNDFRLFNEKNKEIKPDIPRFSKISFLMKISVIKFGNYGITIKPSIIQAKLFLEKKEDIKCQL